MKKVSILFLLLFLTGTMQSCLFLFNDDYLPSQGVIEQTYNYTNFDRLDLGSAFNINVVQGATFQVKVKGDKADVDELIVTVRGGELQIYYRNNRSRRYAMYVDVVMPTLTRANFSGASTSIVTGFSNAQEVDILLSGASRSTVSMSAKYINIDLSGASTLDLSGSSFRTDSQISGASVLNAFAHTSEEAVVSVSGASRARVNATKQLKGSASGASNVRFRGNPQVSIDVSGSSVVEKD